MDVKGEDLLQLFNKTS